MNFFAHIYRFTREGKTISKHEDAKKAAGKSSNSYGIPFDFKGSILLDLMANTMVTDHLSVHDGRKFSNLGPMQL